MNPIPTKKKKKKQISGNRRRKGKKSIRNQLGWRFVDDNRDKNSALAGDQREPIGFERPSDLVAEVHKLPVYLNDPSSMSRRSKRSTRTDLDVRRVNFVVRNGCVIALDRRDVCHNSWIRRWSVFVRLHLLDWGKSNGSVLRRQNLREEKWKEYLRLRLRLRLGEEADRKKSIWKGDQSRKRAIADSFAVVFRHQNDKRGGKKRKHRDREEEENRCRTTDSMSHGLVQGNRRGIPLVMTQDISILVSDPCWSSITSRRISRVSIWMTKRHSSPSDLRRSLEDRPDHTWCPQCHSERGQDQLVLAERTEFNEHEE